MSLLPHQQRVVDELLESETRLKALVRFTLGDVFYALPEEDRDLLLIQRAQMAALNYTLSARIKRFY